MTRARDFNYLLLINILFSIHANLIVYLIDEPGVFIGKILPNNPTRAFLGYVDEKASGKKVVRDVFTKGDSAFLSGI